MSGIVQTLDEATMAADIAANYAGQPMRHQNPSTLGAPDAIVQLVELGDPNRNIPPCAACHRHDDGGPIEAPILSDQRQEYLTSQLKMFASGQRRNDVYGRMRAIAGKLGHAN
jgi:cytochrome c553